MAQKMESDLGAQKTFSNVIKEELDAAMTMLPAPMGRVALAQSRQNGCILNQVPMPTMFGIWVLCYL